MLNDEKEFSELNIFNIKKCWLHFCPIFNHLTPATL